MPKLKPKGGGSKKKSARPRTANGTGGGNEHNMRVDKKVARKFFDQLDALHDQKASSAASFASRIGDTYETGKNELGVSMKAFKEAYAEHKWEKAKQARRAEMEAEIRDQVDRIVLAVASYASTPLGKAAAERDELAATTEKDRKAEASSSEGAQASA